MDKISQKDIEWLMNLHKGADGTPTPVVSSSGKRMLFRLFIVTAGILGLVIFPFYLLVRTSVYLSLAYDYSAWPALAGGALATILLLLIYLFFLFRKVRNKKQLLKISLTGVSVMVFGFCMFGLLYLSGENAKSPEVRQLYRTMHPVLRVAVATVTLADGGMVITDIARQPESYAAMGLPENPQSLHYHQKSGYVHAVDLRTRNRGLIRNALLRGSLEVMGFRTLRHTGTADHLHVELKEK